MDPESGEHCEAEVEYQDSGNEKEFAIPIISARREYGAVSYMLQIWHSRSGVKKWMYHRETSPAIYYT